jgi:putative oxidoreductase
MNSISNMTSNYHKENTGRSPSDPYYRYAKNALRFIGRMMIGGSFLVIGIGDIFNWNALLSSAEMNLGLVSAVFLLVLTILPQVIGGLFLFLGYRIRFGALLLIIFTILATVLFYDFWDLDEKSLLIPLVQAYHYQAQFFLKNIAITGGLFYILANGADPWSVDAFRRKKRTLAKQ